MSDNNTVVVAGKNYKKGLEPVEISLDGLIIRGLGGREIAPFAGESVWVNPLITEDEEIELEEMLKRLTDNESATSEEALDMTRGFLSRIVIDWNATYQDGSLRPKPYKNPDAFKGMGSKLLFAFAMMLVFGETPNEKKVENGALPGGRSTNKRTRRQN